MWLTATTAASASSLDVSAATTRVDGGSTSDTAGNSVATGNINGDGYGDIIVGAPMAENGDGESNAGRVYVIFGSAALPAQIDLSSTSFDGFVIEGANVSDLLGASVAAIPDMNGDGRDEIAVGATGAGSEGNGYLIYGKTSSAAVDLDALRADVSGVKWFEIRGDSSTNGNLGYTLAGSPDMNGDGRGEIVIGDSTHAGDGSVYVVFGQESTSADNISAVDIGTHGNMEGFLIEAGSIDLSSSQAYVGAAVGVVDDMNGDGLSEVVVGAFQCACNAVDASEKSGAAFVVFGRSTRSPNVVDLGDIGSSGNADGWAIIGSVDGSIYANLGSGVAGSSDRTGDGIPDLAIGSKNVYESSGDIGGAVYLLPGRASTGSGSTVNVDDLDESGSGGIKIGGVSGDNGYADSVYADFGAAVTNLGDIDSDGTEDIGIGAPGLGENGSDAGGAFAVYGSTEFSSGEVAINDLAVDGDALEIFGDTADSNTGNAIAGGDIDGDGRSDVLVTAYLADNNSRSNSGSVYLFASTTLAGDGSSSDPPASSDTPTTASPSDPPASSDTPTTASPSDPPASSDPPTTASPSDPPASSDPPTTASPTDPVTTSPDPSSGTVTTAAALPTASLRISGSKKQRPVKQRGLKVKASCTVASCKVKVTATVTVKLGSKSYRVKLSTKKKLTKADKKYTVTLKLSAKQKKLLKRLLSRAAVKATAKLKASVVSSSAYTTGKSKTLKLKLSR